MNESQEEKSRHALPRPEWIPVYDYPAGEGMTIGGMLEDMYAEFASDLVRRKLDGTLEQWAKDRLSYKGLADWKYTLVSDAEELLSIKGCDFSITELDEDERFGLANLALVLRYLDLGFGGDAHYEWDVELYGEAAFAPTPVEFTPKTIQATWSYRHYHFNQDAHPMWVLARIGAVGDDAPQKRAWVGLIKEALSDLLPAVYWRLFTRLMPEHINSFVNGEIPPLPRDIKLPDWSGAPKSVQPMERRYRLVCECLDVAYTKVPELREQTAKEIYAWLDSNEQEWKQRSLANYELPNFPTWRRYYEEVKRRVPKYR